MTAIQAIMELMTLVEKHGDLELIVYDGMECPDLCVADHISTHTEGTRLYFRICPGEYLPSWASLKDSDDPIVRAERARLLGAVAKALAANSPFLTLINGGKFPENVTKEIRAEESCGLCNSTDPDHNCPCR